MDIAIGIIIIAGIFLFVAIIVYLVGCGWSLTMDEREEKR